LFHPDIDVQFIDRLLPYLSKLEHPGNFMAAPGQLSGSGGP